MKLQSNACSCSLHSFLHTHKYMDTSSHIPRKRTHTFTDAHIECVQREREWTWTWTWTRSSKWRVKQQTNKQINKFQWIAEFFRRECSRSTSYNDDRCAHSFYQVILFRFPIERDAHLPCLCVSTLLPFEFKSTRHLSVTMSTRPKLIFAVRLSYQYDCDDNYANDGNEMGENKPKWSLPIPV